MRLLFEQAANEEEDEKEEEKKAEPFRRGGHTCTSTHSSLTCTRVFVCSRGASERACVECVEDAVYRQALRPRRKQWQ